MTLRLDKWHSADGDWNARPSRANPGVLTTPRSQRVTDPKNCECRRFAWSALHEQNGDDEIKIRKNSNFALLRKVGRGDVVSGVYFVSQEVNVNTTPMKTKKNMRLGLKRLHSYMISIQWSCIMRVPLNDANELEWEGTDKRPTMEHSTSVNSIHSLMRSHVPLCLCNTLNNRLSDNIQYWPTCLLLAQCDDEHRWIGRKKWKQTKKSWANNDETINNAHTPSHTRTHTQSQKKTIF